MLDVICSAGPDDRAIEERHGHASVSFVLAGSFVYRSARGRALLAAGSVLLGNAGGCFECGHEHGEGDRCLSFHYEPELLEEVAGDLGVPAAFGRASLPPLPALSPLFARAAGKLRGDGDPETLALDALAIALRSANDVRGQRPSRLRDEARVSEAVRFLEANNAEAVSACDLAARAGLSRFHFLRLFRAATGTTPHQYILRLRLRAAAERLAATAAPVTEIAYAVGFEDLSNFTRSFGAEFGLSPSKFRARNA